MLWACCPWQVLNHALSKVHVQLCNHARVFWPARHTLIVVESIGIAFYSEKVISNCVFEHRVLPPLNWFNLNSETKNRFIKKLNKNINEPWQDPVFPDAIVAEWTLFWSGLKDLLKKRRHNQQTRLLNFWHSSLQIQNIVVQSEPCSGWGWGCGREWGHHKQARLLQCGHCRQSARYPLLCGSWKL